MKKIIALISAIRTHFEMQKYASIPIWEWINAIKHYYKWETSIVYRIDWSHKYKDRY